jgi:toxin YoeB
MRTIVIHGVALEHLGFWAANDLKILKRIIELFEDIEKSPFNGIGKPEGLKHELKGYWSRRINDEHRLVYKVTNEEIIIISCRFHY